MSTIKSIFLQHLNGTTPNATMDTNGNFTVGGTVSGASSNMFINRIQNGDMRIDQRNAGAAFGTSFNGFTLDRWNSTQTVSGKLNGGQNYNSITPPAGFKNYIGFQSQSSYTSGSSDQFSIQQWIEGYNIADFDFGTTNAKTVTLSFWVRSSLTGSFSGSVAGYDGANFRSYSFSYTINTANTWEYETITIPGDTTTFSYNSTNSYGLLVALDLGSGTTYKTSSPNTWSTSATYRGLTGSVSIVGTSGATFYVTGVQLEIGTIATPFERRQYGAELALCQRYYQPLNTGATFILMNYLDGTSIYNTNVWYKVTMRAIPTISTSSFTYRVGNSYTNGSVSSVTGTSNYADIRLSCPSAPNTAGTAGHCVLDSGWATSADI